MTQNKKHTLLIMSGETFLLSKLSVEEELKIRGSPLKRIMNIPFGNEDSPLCYQCEKNSFDWCIGCEKPVCERHSYFIVIPIIYIILSLCKNCAEEFENLSFQNQLNLVRENVKN